MKATVLSSFFQRPLTFVSCKTHLKSSRILPTTRMKLNIKFLGSRHYNCRIGIAFASLVCVNRVRTGAFSYHQIIRAWRRQWQRDPGYEEECRMILNSINVPFTCDTGWVGIREVWSVNES